MARILGLSGSLRKGSLNTALLRAAAGLMQDGALEVVTPHGVPLYDADLESEQGIPSAVDALKEQIVASDGLLIATPEYNNGIPGVLKNTLDWLSRPPKDSGRIFGDRPVAVIGATPGGMGTVLAQDALLPVLRTLKTRPWFGGRLMVSRAHERFGPDGTLADETLQDQLRDFVNGFAAFAKA